MAAAPSRTARRTRAAAGWRCGCRRETEGIDSELLGKFCEEARAAGSLGKPNLLAVYEVGAYQHRTFLVTELLEGKSLRETLAAGPLPQKKALTLALQIAQGLQAAHEKGIVHRDLRPETVFVTWDGRAKIMDFGYSLLRNGAPGAKDDASVDIAAFASVLHEMLTGRKPGEVVKLEGERAPQLVALLNKALGRNPGERFQNAAELSAQVAQLMAVDEAAITGPGAYARLNALADVLGRPVGPGTARMALRDLTPTSEGMKPVKPPQEKKSRAVPVVLTLVALAVVALVVFYFGRPH